MANNEDLASVHSAISGYHHTLVGIRFTVAALYLAASAFLASVVFKDGVNKPIVVVSCLFGTFLTIIMWLMEIRNI